MGPNGLRAQNSKAQREIAENAWGRPPACPHSTTDVVDD